MAWSCQQRFFLSTVASVSMLCVSLIVLGYLSLFTYSIALPWNSELTCIVVFGRLNILGLTIADSASEVMTWAHLPLGVTASPLWESAVRKDVTESKMTEQEMNRLRSQLIVPGVYNIPVDCWIISLTVFTFTCIYGFLSLVLNHLINFWVLLENSHIGY